MWETFKFVLCCFGVCCLISVVALCYMVWKAPTINDEIFSEEDWLK